jgi:hypothetical protein
VHYLSFDFLFGVSVEVLGFLIGGLLVSCASSALITWELNAYRSYG